MHSSPLTQLTPLLLSSLLSKSSPPQPCPRLPPFTSYTLFKPWALTFSSKAIADVYQQAAGTEWNSQKQLCSAKCLELVHCCISVCVSKLNVLDWRFCNKMFWVIRVNFLNRCGLIISCLLFVDAIVTELSFFAWFLATNKPYSSCHW